MYECTYPMLVVRSRQSSGVRLLGWKSRWFYEDRDGRCSNRLGMDGSEPARTLWRQHPSVVVVAFGLLGSALGWALALSTRSKGEVATAWLWPFAIAAAIAAGTLGGVFLGLVTLHAIRARAAVPTVRHGRVPARRHARHASYL